MKRGLHIYYYYIVFVICVGILSAFFFWWLPFSGDDLAYKSVFKYYYSWPLDYPRYMARHWVFNNGRMADKLLIGALAGIGKPFLGLIIGCGVSATLLYAGKFVRNKLWLALSLCLFLQWWDMTNTSTCFNYIVSSALIVWACHVLLQDNRPGTKTFFKAFLVFIAMSMHEAAGIPAMCGVTAYIIANRQWKTFPSSWKIIYTSGMAGVLFTLSSPGNYTRLSAYHVADDSPMVLILKSAFPVLVLAVYCLVLLLCSNGRSRLKCLITTKWIAFAIAAVVSTGFCFISGIVGRSGWFASVFALIALFMMFRKRRLAALSVIIALVYIVHLSWTVTIQYKLNKENERVISEYCESNNGIVTYTPTGYHSLPYPELLYRPIGAPTMENKYVLECFDNYYSNGQKHLRYENAQPPQWRPGERPILKNK